MILMFFIFFHIFINKNEKIDDIFNTNYINHSKNKINNEHNN